MCSDQNLDLSGPDKVVPGPQIRGILLNLSCFPLLDLPVASFLQRLNSLQVLAGEAPPPRVCGIVGNGVLLRLCSFLLCRCEGSGVTPENTCSVSLTGPCEEHSATLAPPSLSGGGGGRGGQGGVRLLRLKVLLIHSLTLSTR